MAEYHVGCGNFGIYAGTLKKNSHEWLNKSNVTREALSASALYLLIQGVYYTFEYGGKKYMMTVREETDG